MPTRRRTRGPVTVRNWMLALPLLAAALAAAACSTSNYATLPPPLGGPFPTSSAAPPTAAPPTTAAPTTASPTTSPTATPSATSTARATATPKPTGTPTTKPKPNASGTVIATGHTKLGTILVNSKGITVYLFEKDTGTKSTCYGACPTIWPPVLTKGSPVAGAGAQASLLGTTKRTNGSLQVTYAGHPLYYYAGDSKPGQTNGQGISEFGAKWEAVRPSGVKAG